MPDPEIIEISYSAVPPGQVGTRPRKIPRNSQFQIMTKDKGTFTIEFTGESPLSSNEKKPTITPAAAGSASAKLRADKSGRFPFKCTLVRNGVTITIGDPSNPIPVDGEIEVGC